MIVNLWAAVRMICANAAVSVNLLIGRSQNERD